jgi:pimeloyl-ACP methyl ester carboxylesterase
MNVLGSAAFFNGWDTQVKCESEFTPAIRDVIRSTMLEFDPLGSTWGTAGVRRAPVQNTRWGWNATFASKIEAPTLLIRGDLDSTIGGGVAEAAVRALYADLTTERKVFVHAACASHFFVWENQHMILLRASEEWLRDGTFAGHTGGSFFVDTEGHVHEE